ncbi:MAG: cyclic nucleotide-binding domain-containing protein [Thermodesulfobacteriota bacterium]
MAEENSYQRGEGAAKLILDHAGEVERVPVGTRVVSQGDEPHHFFVIQSGRLKVFRENEEGIRTDLTVLGPGDYFGEVALVTGQVRTASVETLEEAVLLKISKEEFDRVLDNNPKLARHIINQLANWLVTGDRRLESEVVHQVKLRQISWFDYVLLFGLILLLAVGFNFFNPNGIPLVQDWGVKDNVPRIGIKEAAADYKKQEALFIDARPTNFFNQKHIKGALNVPMPLFDFLYLMQLSQVPKDKPLIVYGHNISRKYDLDVARKLLLRGHEKVMILGGGSTAWEKGQFPLEPIK